jgi:uncharacterized protein YbcI
MDGDIKADQASLADATNDGSPERGSQVLRAVSNAMVRIYKEQFGRGPESAHSHFVGPDIIMTVLSNSLTPVERSMLTMGEHSRLREIRLMFQHATEDRFRAEVEHATGRRVTAFMSGMDIEADIACEVFTLEPLGPSDG